MRDPGISGPVKILRDGIKNWSLAHRRAVLILNGISLGLMFLAFNFPNDPEEFGNVPLSKFEIRGSGSVETAGPGMFVTSALQVEYPPTMRENQTLLVSLSYQEVMNVVENPLLRGDLKEDLVAHLLIPLLLESAHINWIKFLEN
ncbi:MAG: hypothetical protein KF712_10490 [Akkermansiaceae bacterium]|nr:hypothetical protein [Akkermansiaceae bacterium]